MERYALTYQGVSSKKRRGILKDINLSLECGYIYVITGENGAGKSTLLQCLLAEKENYQGKILFYEREIKGKHSEVMKEVGWVSNDKPFFEERTGMQNAQILGLLYPDFDLQIFKDAMKKMQASTTTTYKKMSRGEKIKFQLAFAMAHHSKLYLLDEATAGMDPVFRRVCYQMLRQILLKDDCCILMTCQNEDEIAKQTDYVAVMEHGKLGNFKESSLEEK